MKPVDFETEIRETDVVIPLRQLQYIGPYPITEIRSTIERLAESLGEKGGFLRLYDLGDTRNGIGTPEQIFGEKFGFYENPSKSVVIFKQFSEEKALRLIAHQRHHSSHESRNDKKGHFGGAIRTKNHFVISCHGNMNEAQSEAISLCLAVHLCWLTNEEALHIAQKSDNKAFPRLLKTITGKKKA